MIKKISQKNKERLADFVEAIDGVENKVPTTMKNVINFKGRKSPDIAEIGLKTLTDESAVVYDPFMGAGSFVLASVSAGRKIIATELDNYTYSAVYSLLFDADSEKLQTLFNSVEKEAKASIMELYSTCCCGVKNYISKLFFDPETSEYYNPTTNRDIIDGENIIMASKCPKCQKRRKKFDDLDMKSLEQLELADTSLFPHSKYIENSRINITSSTGADYYDRIFTKRNQKALLILQEAILKLPKSKERDIIEQALVSSLSLARISMYGSSTDILYHVVPYGGQESNVWELFESKFNSVIKFKREYLSALSKSPEKNNLYEIHLSSFQDFCQSVNKECFDIIYTDFPYTDQVPYLERNQLYRVWLNTFYDKGNFDLSPKMLEQEIVQTNAPSRAIKQDINNYYAELDRMFATFYEVLKPNSLMVFTVKLGKSKYFTTLLEIINLARKNGFEYALRIGIDKNDPTIRKQAAYKNTLSNEMIIAFEKLDKKDHYWYVGQKNYEFETTKIVYRLIQKSTADISMSTTVKAVKDKLFKEHGYATTEDDLLRIQNIISENFLVEKNTAIVRIDCNRLYLDIEDNTDLFTKMYDYIPVIIDQLFKKSDKFTLDDLYFELANSLCNGDPGTINQFIDNPSYNNSINILLSNYCNMSDKVYTKKKYNKELSDDAIDISMLDGTSFEHLITSLLEASGYYDVVNTGGAGDLGVDILARKKDENGQVKRYLFQCKRWVANVGSEPMQRLVSERERRKADVAVCVTTSDFTNDGKLISSEQDIIMWNGEYVARELNLYFPNKYYNGMV